MKALTIGLFQNTHCWIRKAKELGDTVIACHEIESDKGDWDLYTQKLLDENLIEKLINVEYTDIDQLQKICVEEEVDYILPKPGSNEALKSGMILIDLLGYPGVGWNKGAKLTDKLLLNDWLKQYNLAAFDWQYDENDWEKVTEFPCVLKNRLGAGSVGCRIIRDKDQLKEVLTNKTIKDNYWSNQKGTKIKHVIQPYVDHKHLVRFSAIVDNGKINFYHLWDNTPRGGHITQDGTHHGFTFHPESTFIYGPTDMTSHLDIHDLNVINPFKELIEKSGVDNCSIMGELFYDFEKHEPLAWFDINLRPTGCKNSNQYINTVTFDVHLEEVKQASGRDVSFNYLNPRYSHSRQEALNWLGVHGKVKHIKFPDLKDFPQIINAELYLQKGDIIPHPKDVQSYYNQWKMGHLVIVGNSQDDVNKILMDWYETVELEVE